MLNRVAEDLLAAFVVAVGFTAVGPLSAGLVRLGLLAEPQETSVAQALMTATVIVGFLIFRAMRLRRTASAR